MSLLLPVLHYLFWVNEVKIQWAKKQVKENCGRDLFCVKLEQLFLIQTISSEMSLYLFIMKYSTLPLLSQISFPQLFRHLAWAATPKYHRRSGLTYRLWFLTVLEAGSPRSGCQQICFLVRVWFLAFTCLLAVSSHDGETESSGFSSPLKDTSIMGTHSHDCIQI